MCVGIRFLVIVFTSPRKYIFVSEKRKNRNADKLI